MSFARLTPRTHRGLAFGAWAVATGLIVLMARTVDMRRLLHAIAAADAGWLVSAAAINLLIQLFGALQWHALLPPTVRVGRRRMLRLFSLTSVANNTTPSLVGHLTGAALLAGEPGVGAAAALSTLALDQLAVGIVKVGILLIASALLPLPEWIHQGRSGLAALVAALALAAVVIARRTPHLAALREPRRLFAGVGFAAAVKLTEAGAIACVVHAFGLTVSVDRVAVVLAAATLASVVPIAPANLGPYEAAAYAAYRHLGLAPDAALGIALVQHMCQLLPAVGAGYLLLSARRRPSIASRAHASQIATP